MIRAFKCLLRKATEMHTYIHKLVHEWKIVQRTEKHVTATCSYGVFLKVKISAK